MYDPQVHTSWPTWALGSSRCVACRTRSRCQRAAVIEYVARTALTVDRSAGRVVVQPVVPSHVNAFGS
ncbi:Uncharacterised protein [Mycobacteroides abscessus]|nr:Uncharacterised protein [Mycobacteroides abscessus]